MAEKRSKQVKMLCTSLIDSVFVGEPFEFVSDFTLFPPASVERSASWVLTVCWVIAYDEERPGAEGSGRVEGEE